MPNHKLGFDEASAGGVSRVDTVFRATMGSQSSGSKSHRGA